MSSKLVMAVAHGVALAGVVAGISVVTPPAANATVKQFNECIKGANPDAWKQCCVGAGGTVDDTDGCWFNGNALSSDPRQATQPTLVPKPVVAQKAPPPGSNSVG